MALSQAVCVETSTENAIIEVTYDGIEIYQPALTLGEHLTKQASKIDFSNLENEDEEENEEMERESDDDENESNETERKDSERGAEVWPWENVRNKLKDAWTELCVLSDVLSIATNDVSPGKRYMVLDGPVQVETQESRPYVSCIAKKKSLDLPAKILLQGAEHLKLLQVEKPTCSTVKNSNEFHVELLRLRQNWRLKKVSNSILGDLSYRTAGSHYKQSGIFEVSKVGENSFSSEDSSKTSALSVTVPSELEGMAFIQVSIQSDLESSENSFPSFLSNLSSVPNVVTTDVHWQTKLEQAQNVLFCKELFAQLAKEAIELEAPIPHMVVGTLITASLFPNVRLLISLSHTMTTPSTTSSTSESKPETPAPKEHSHVFEHSLHQLLRQMHRKNISSVNGESLSSAPVGVSKKRRLAGPGGADRYSLLQMAKSETLLEQILAQAQHVYLRHKTMSLLDSMALEIKDPLISCHWSTYSSPTLTSVKVLLLTQGYDSIVKTQFLIKVSTNSLTIVGRDGRVHVLSSESSELKDFLLTQISLHQSNGIQALSRVMGWEVLSSNSSLGSGALEPLSNVAGVILKSPSGSRLLSIRISPLSSHPIISVSSAPVKDFFPVSLILNKHKWSHLPDSYQQLELQNMDGKNLLGKLELLMAALTESSHGK